MAGGKPIRTRRGLVPGFTRTQDTVGVPEVEMGGDRARHAARHRSPVVTDPAPEGGDTRQNAETLDPGSTASLTVSLFESLSLRRTTDTPAGCRQVRGGGYSHQ